MIYLSTKKFDENIIFKYLSNNSGVFIPPLQERINIKEYSTKIWNYANQVWAINLENDEIAGFMACYFNDYENLVGYITTISVINKYQGQKIGYFLLKQAIEYALKEKFKKIKLEVYIKNHKAISFYEKNNFKIIELKESSYLMEKIV